MIPIDGRKMFPDDLELNKNWECFQQGGIEFPVIDFPNKMGKDYNHFWVGGFGTIMQDR